MKIAAAYIRVSTDDQIELSPDSQIKQIREYAQKYDYLIPREYIFVDEGISGKNTAKRPAFNQMIGLAKTKPKPFEIILLWKFSRFARNREDSVVYKSMLRKQLGIDVISITENLGDDKMSILMEALIEAMDEYYSINLAEEVRRGMLEKVQRGKPVSYAPFGYRIENQEYVIDKPNAEIVKQIFDDFLIGMGYREIASKLNTMGCKTRFCNHFENRTVLYILSNPVYTGKIRWNEYKKSHGNHNQEDTIVVDGTHTPIIDPATFQRAQQRITEIRNQHIPYRRNSSAETTYLLKGLVRCSNCKSTLVRTAKTSLQCNAYTKGNCSVSHSVVVRRIDALVLSALEPLFPTGIFQLAQRNLNQASEKQRLTELQLKQEERKLEKIKDAYYAGADTVEEYRQNKITTLKKIESLKTQISSSLPAMHKQHSAKRRIRLIDMLKDKTVSEQEKNSLLLAFVDHITYRKEDESIEIVFYQS